MNVSVQQVSTGTEQDVSVAWVAESSTTKRTSVSVQKAQGGMASDAQQSKAARTEKNGMCSSSCVNVP